MHGIHCRDEDVLSRHALQEYEFDLEVTEAEAESSDEDMED